MDHVSQLISDYLDGELDEAGVVQLADSLREIPPRSTNWFWIPSFIRSCIIG